MRKLLTIFLLTAWFYLCMTVIVNAQVKPVSPALQAGWSTSCVRALILDEGSGTALTDLSGTATVSLNAAAWSSDSEGPFFDNTASSQFISLNTGLPGASVSAYTWYMRIKWESDGPIGAYAATYTGGGTAQSDVQWYENVSSTDAMNFGVRNATNCAECVGTVEMVGSPSTKHNIIAEYDGDSLRVYDNNVRSCAVKLTNGGNLLNSGYTTRVGQGHNAATDACTGNAGTTNSQCRVYTVVIWQRVLTPTERAQIQSDPYVMFREAAAGGRRNVIVIQSMLPNIDSLFYLITYFSLIGIAAGIYKFFWQEKRMKRAGDR